MPIVRFRRERATCFGVLDGAVVVSARARRGARCGAVAGATPAAGHAGRRCCRQIVAVDSIIASTPPRGRAVPAEPLIFLNR
jgi:hypothetical protein